MVSLNETVAALSYHCFWMPSRIKISCHQLQLAKRIVLGGSVDSVSGVLGVFAFYEAGLVTSYMSAWKRVADARATASRKQLQVTSPWCA